MPTRTVLPNIGIGLLEPITFPPDFRIEVCFDRLWAVVTVDGDVDAYTAPTLGSLLDALVTAGHRRVMLDVGGVTLMSAAGLRAIAVVERRLRAGDGSVVLRSVPAVIRRSLVITGLITELAIATPRSALDVLRHVPAHRQHVSSGS